MDLTRAISYRGATLNNPLPAVGKPGITGCMVEVADITDIGHAEFTERLREQDGLNAIESYTALQTVTLQGSLFAPTRGALFLALQALREVFSPMKALLESPSTKGFLPLTYYEAHDVVDVRLKTLSCRPLGLRWKVNSQMHGTTGSRTDASALVMAWTVQLLVDLNPPTPYDTSHGGGAPVDSWPPAPEDITGIFRCTVPPKEVVWVGGGGDGYVAIPPGGYGPYENVATCTLYAGCTYRVNYTVYHSPGSNDIKVWMFPATGPATAYANANMGSRCPDGVGGPGSHLEAASRTFTVPETRPFHVRLDSQFYFYCDNGNTTVCARVYYVSGPDPRYGPELCVEGTPADGQLVRITEVVTAGGHTSPDGSRGCEYSGPPIFPYLPGSLVITVDGVVIASSEVDPATGQYSFNATLIPTGSTFVLDYRRVAPFGP